MRIGRKGKEKGGDKGQGGGGEKKKKGAPACHSFQTQRKMSTWAEVQLLAPVYRFITL